MTSRRHQIRSALTNQLLRDTLDRFTTTYLDQRIQACSRIDFSSARHHLTELRRDNIPELKQLAHQFTHQATAAGAVVKFADDAATARQLILECVNRHSVTSVIKSKSMTTEEIALNQALESNGQVVTETDLGEWILQISQQPPSHMVMPAIHMSADDVAEVFSKHLQREINADRRLLVDTARAELRKHMVTADLGITGANMLIADTGTVVLVTNEGNGRFVTTYPRVHIVIAGIDRLVPEMDTMCKVMELLPRCASGQAISSYVSMFTGTRPDIDELLIILLDNGRSQLASDPELSEALACIRCCSCLNVCPVYKEVGGHAFGSTYFGGIGVLLQFMLEGQQQVMNLQSLCTACGRCTEFCPVSIDIAGLIERLRQRYPARVTERGVAALIGSRGTGPAKISRITRPLSQIITDSKTRTLKISLPEYCSGTPRLPAPASRPLTTLLKQRSTPTGPTVVLFSGCLTELCFTNIGTAIYDLLVASGFCPVVINGCCGSPIAGFSEQRLKNIASYVVGRIASVEPVAVITPCPSCTHMIRDKYPALLPDSADVLSIAGITTDFIQYWHQQGQTLPGNYPHRVTYHDSCHLRWRSAAGTAPRQVLTKLSGLELLEQGPTAGCCGFAGLYTINQPQIARAILNTKIKSITETTADTVIVDCPGCMLQIRSGLVSACMDISVLHSSQLLAASINNQ